MSRVPGLIVVQPQAEFQHLRHMESIQEAKLQRIRCWSRLGRVGTKGACLF